MQLQNRHGSDKVIALPGNHEDMVCDGRWIISGNGDEDTFDREEDDTGYLMWMQNLPRYYVEGNTIFVHAGIYEEAEDLWEWKTDDHIFTEKYPAQTGRFYNDMKKFDHKLHLMRFIFGGAFNILKSTQINEF